jgi:hypothetical protein
MSIEYHIVIQLENFAFCHVGITCWIYLFIYKSYSHVFLKQVLFIM